jgi:lauroyl/myristoyl acyltransferase
MAASGWSGRGTTEGMDLSVLSEETHAPIPQGNRLRNVHPLLRLYASPHSHRLLPASLALPIAAVLEPSARRLLRPGSDEYSVRLMKDLLQYTPRSNEARAIARRYLRESSRARELLWRPWLLKHSRIIGREHWDAACSGGRGCVLVCAHIGPSWAVPGILGRHGFDLHLVTSVHFWQEMAPGLTGLSHRHMRVEYAEKTLGRERLIPNNAEPERLIELVESGASVGIAFDVPGSAATPFLGRSVALTGGPATLAFQTKAQVLPVISERHGTRIDLRMLEPIDPADYRDPRSLRAAIARVYEPFVLEKPEIIEVAWYPSPLVTEVLTVQAPPSEETPLLT